MSLLTLLAPSVTSTAAAPAIIISQDTNFNGLSLWRITSQNGVITGKRDDRVFGGISNINLGSANYVAPTFGSITGPTATSASAGLSSDVTITVPFTNIPQDGIAQRIVWLYRTSGTSAWVPWAETTIPGLPSPSAAQTVSFTYQGLTNGSTLDFGCAYVALSGAAGTAATLASNFSPAASTVTLLQNKNLLSNGNFYQNGSYVADAIGWKRFNSAPAVTVTGTYGAGPTGSQSFTSAGVTGIANTGDGIYQIVNVKPGQKYSYCALNYNNIGGGTSQIWIGSTGFGAAYNSPGSDPAPIGTIGSYYSYYPTRLAGQNTNAGGTYYVLSGTFTVPNNVSQVAFLLETLSSTSVNTSFWGGVMFWEGTKYQDYVDSENPLGQQTSTTPFTSGVGNLVIANGDCMLNYSTTTSEVDVWLTNGAQTGPPTWIMMDGTPYYATNDGTATGTTNAGTSGAPLAKKTGLTTSTKVWVYCYYNPSTKIWAVDWYTSVPTSAQAAKPYQDGSFLAAFGTAATANSYVTTPTSGGGGTTGGGTGGRTPPPVH